MKDIALPMKIVAAIDQMDCGMDLLRTIQIALAADTPESRDGSLTIAAALDIAIRMLDPVRDAIDAEHVGGDHG